MSESGQLYILLNLADELRHLPKLFKMENDRKQEIEKIAWEVFLHRTGLRFRRELTPEQKLKISKVPDYENYRQEAEKIYEKKQQALLNKKYPIINVPSTGKPGWSGGAHTLCFVYSKFNGNFVLKGYYKEIQDYLKKNYTHYFCNYSLWHHGFNRDIWDFWNDKIGIFEPSLREKRRGKKIEVRPYSIWSDDDETTVEKDKNALRFKRLPKRWIPEFDKL